MRSHPPLSQGELRPDSCVRSDIETNRARAASHAQVVKPVIDPKGIIALAPRRATKQAGSSARSQDRKRSLGRGFAAEADAALHCVSGSHREPCLRSRPARKTGLLCWSVLTLRNVFVSGEASTAILVDRIQPWSSRKRSVRQPYRSPHGCRLTPDPGDFLAVARSSRGVFIASLHLIIIASHLSSALAVIVA